MQAYLFGADLSDAHLNGADLTSANLYRARLTGARLEGAHLDRANLAGADLQGAELAEASLRHTDLTSADLSSAWLGGAQLEGALFEPKSLPTLRGIANANGLELLTYQRGPDSLVQLRKQFADGGFIRQEREITYAIKRREAELAWAGCTSRKLPQDKTRAVLWSSDGNLANCAAYIMNRAFFDWTCQYGMSPGRALSLGVLLWLSCSVLYFACIHASKKGGLYRVYGKGIGGHSLAHPREERISSPSNLQTHGSRGFLQFFRHEWLVWRSAMFFSLMSAFNIGFRDINFGRWLRLLTREELDIKAVGWARVIAGWQSLISVFLIALWVLTYFGRPFENQ